MSAVSARALTDAIFSSDAVTRAMGDDAHLAALVTFEARLAQAQAGLDVISREHAAAITDALASFALPSGDDRAALFADAAKNGTIVVPFVKRLTAHVAKTSSEAAGFIHFGATSQDAIDTALVLQIKSALRAVRDDGRRIVQHAAILAERHRATPMLGRTLLQPAVPIPFGLKAAQWLAGIVTAVERIDAAARDALTLQFGGAAGTLGSLGTKGPALAEALADALGLPVPSPALPWHTRRGALAALGAALAIGIGSAGKIARDVSLMMQFEIGEAAEPAGEGRGGSSAMPHKRNPVRCMVALANATRAPGLVATLLSGLVAEHERALGPWQAEWAVWPDLLACAGGSFAGMADVLEGLTVDARRMRANLDALHGLPMTEAVSLDLSAKIGRDAAQGAVERAARRVTDESISLRDALQDDPSITAVLPPGDIAALTDTDVVRGAADVFIDAALDRAAMLLRYQP